MKSLGSGSKPRDSVLGEEVSDRGTGEAYQIVKLTELASDKQMRCQVICTSAIFSPFTFFTMKKTITSPAFINDADLTHLFEVEELEQRLENSWTESIEASTDNGGSVKAGVSHTF